jgi:copper chaperone NosL
MKKSVLILQILAVLCLGLIYAFPIWHITLIAPQYPDGITLFIWLDHFSGDQPGTIQNINILNHYVGMKLIEAEMFPELYWFPKIVAGFIGLGLIAFIKKGKFIWIFTVLLVLTAIAGLYDFYLWEYDYGHTLSPTAPIKVPGQAYQPPLFGRKLLLNFVAISYPSPGGFFYGFAVFFSGMAAWFQRKNKNMK